MNATISTLRPDRPTPETPAPPRPGGFVSDALISLAIFAAFAALFVGCSARAPLWGDSAKLSIFLLDNDYGKRRLTSGMGHHTLTVAGGRLVADIAGLPPHRGLAVLSALCGAGSAALLFLLLRGYGLSQAVGLFCAAAFAMAHMNLFAFTVQESYAPMMVLWLGMLLCFQALRRTPSPVVSLVCGALVGLSVANHSLSVMLYGIVLFPALVLRHGLRRSAAPTLFGLIGFAAAFGPIYFLLMTPPDASVALDQEIGSAFASWVNYRSLPKGLVFFALWTGLQLPLVWLVIGVNVRQWRRPIVADIGPHLAVIAVTAVFTSMYIIQRRMLMMTIALPSILVLAAAAIDTLGLSSKSLRRLAPAAVVFNLVLYSAVAAVMGPLVTKIVPELRVNHWRPADYYFKPFAHLWTDPSQMRDELDEQFPPFETSGRLTSLVLDFTFVKPLLYYRLQDGWREDIELIDTDFWLLDDEATTERRVRDFLSHAAEEQSQIVMAPYPDRVLGRLKMESFADVELKNDHAVVRPKPEFFPPR